jgi:hypothetical protein
MVHREGYYWFANTETMFERPEVVTTYWKCWPAIIGESSYDGVEAIMHSNDFGTSVMFRMGVDSRNWSADQYTGKSRPGDFTETVPLPCPKVRKGTETRYRHGKWEKYTAKGFVSA